jgi:hypothetical protein
MNAVELSERTTKVIECHTKTRPVEAELASFRLTRLNHAGHNSVYRVQGNDGRHWFVKFCRHNDNRILDICEREVLVSLLGELLQVPVVRAWSIPAGQLRAPDLPVDASLSRDRCVLMPLLSGSSVADSRRRATELARSAPSLLANLFAFMHWVGDEDRGLGDVFLADDTFVLIDNGLCGPGRDPVLRGAHPDAGVYRGNPERIVKKCYPHKASLVAFVLRDAGVPASELRRPNVIESIEALPDRAVRQIVQTAGLASWIGDVLIVRQGVIRGSYLEWLSQAAQACALP